MEKKNLDWANLGFGYMVADYRYVSNYKDGKWDDGEITTDDKITLSECAGVFQYAQTVFEGLKAYTTEDGRIVCFRPDLNAARLKDSAERLEMPVFPEDRFIKAVEEVVKANAAWVPPFGSVRLPQVTGLQAIVLHQSFGAEQTHGQLLPGHFQRKHRHRLLRRLGYIQCNVQREGGFTHTGTGCQQDQI